MEERRMAEVALQQERNKLKAILDSMSDGVYVVDQEHEVLYTIPPWRKNWGWSKGTSVMTIS